MLFVSFKNATAESFLYLFKLTEMSIKVGVRIRPFNGREKDLKCECVVDMKSPSTILKATDKEKERVFTFDYSFWSFDGFEEVKETGYYKPTGDKYCDQQKVYNEIGTKILDNAWAGYHCCLFAYGQTGSGKSYSMIGTPTNKGIVPIACTEIFNRTKLKKEDEDYEVKVSMIQIYNEKVQDLTIDATKRPASGLQIRENKVLGIYVDGVKKTLVSNFAQIETVMAEGTKNRTIAATQMNATSSRAHTIITIQFKYIKKNGATKSQRTSVINLVDLAGSQRQSKTAATGDRLKEAIGINQSLSSLGIVISTLAENAEGAKKHVPYRDSALTRILTNALGGNSQTVMICAISPASDNYDQTVSTLRYADAAKKIKNKPVVNESQTDKLIKDLRAENQRLKKLLAEKGGDPGAQPKKAEEPANGQKKPEGQTDGQKPSEKKIEEKKPEGQTDVKKPEEKKPEEKKQQGQADGKKPEEKNNADDKKKKKDDDSDSDSDDDEALKAKIDYLNKLLEEEKKSSEQKAAQAKKQLQEMKKNENAQDKKMEELAKAKKNIPPFFEYISKDFMLNRKLKILIQKPKMTVGKTSTKPPPDIPFGGRDIAKEHALIQVEPTGVYLSPLTPKCHLYMNGHQVLAKEKMNHLDRVIFGWNSVFLFKDHDYDKSDDKVGGKEVDWEFVKKEMEKIVDIDQSDSEQGGSGCCSIY